MIIAIVKEIKVRLMGNIVVLMLFIWLILYGYILLKMILKIKINYLKKIIFKVKIATSFFLLCYNIIYYNEYNNI